MESGKSTIRVESEFFNKIYDDPKMALEYFKSNNLFMTLHEGIKNELKLKGVSGSDAQLFEIFYKILQVQGVAPVKATAKRWFFGNTNLSRDNAIKICFAFELSDKYATAFLNKACFKDGFDFRNAMEIIFKYCLKNGKSYSDAQKLYSQYSEFVSTSSINDEKSTIIIRKEFDDLPNNDADLLNLLQSNKHLFKEFSRTAFSWYKILKEQLISDIKRDADFIRQETEEQRSVNQKIDNARLLRSLYLGFPIKTFERAQKEVDFISADESEIPMIIAKIPVDWNLSEIDRKKKPVPREILILFKFFSVFFLLAEEDRSILYDDFVADMNAILEECGMSCLYPRNPFDCLVMLSAEKEYPFDYFNDILLLSFNEIGEI